MNKRQIAKIAAQLLVSTSVGSFVTKAMVANAPKTQQAHVAEVSGMVAGIVVADKLSPQTNKLVDDLFDRFAKKTTK